MPKGWRFVFWLGVIAIGAAIWMSWWAASGFWIPICRDASGSDGCLSYGEIRAWTSETSGYALRLADLANRWAALITAIFTGVLALFTARLWISTNKLWSVTNKTLEHSERTTRKELRAYLTVEALGINEYIGHNYLVGHFRIRNLGKIAAKDVSVYSTMALDTDGRRTSFPIAAPRLSPTVLQPGAEMEFGSYEGWQIPADQLDSNEPLKVRGYLYVWGEVVYTDEFKTAGWTAFCHRYPCDMFGMTKRKEATGRGSENRRIHQKFARYHEEGGNEAG